MIKKLLLIAAFLTVGALAHAEYLEVPKGPSQALDGADYGGVDRSTVSLSSANVQCVVGLGSVVGFICSSAPAIASTSDFIIFRDTVALIAGATSASNTPTDDYTTGGEFARVYIATNTVINPGGGQQLGTTYMFPKPIRFYKGLIVKASNNVYNMITILFTKFGK